jgi:hypothetical protein
VPGGSLSSLAKKELRKKNFRNGRQGFTKRLSHRVATWQTEPVVWFVDCELNGCGNPPKKILQDERLKQVLSGVQFREARIIEGSFAQPL